MIHDLAEKILNYCPEVYGIVCCGTHYVQLRVYTHYATKMLSSKHSERLSGTEAKASVVNPFDFYVYVDNHCRQKAAKESKDLEQFAECIASSRAKQDGNFLQNLSSKAESYIFEQMQQNVFQELWQEASKAVYGQ